MADEKEDDLLRTGALQNAQAILLARQRAEQELIQAKEALEQKTEELARAKELFQNVFDQAPVGIARIDATGRWLMVNPRLCETLGYTPEELLAVRLSQLTHPDDVAADSEMMSRLLSGEARVYRREKRYLRKDGTVVWVNLTLSGESETARAADRSFIAVIQDITDRKRAEDERQVFVSFLENSPDFIGIADPNGKPVYLNPAGRRMVGLPADYPVQNTQIPEYYSMDQRAFASDVIVRSMIEQGRWHGETYFRDWQTEEAIPVSDEHFMIRDPKTGRLLGMGTITRDISDARRTAAEREQLFAREQTARRQAETANAQLLESQEKYRALFDSIDECFFVMEVLFDDADNAVDFRFLEVNPAFEKQASLPNLVGRRVREVEPALEEHWFQIYGQVARTGESRRFENQALGRFYDLYAFRFGKPEHRQVAVLFTDITERKRVEQALRLSEAKFSGIVSIAADAIISIDEDQQITIFNEGAERIFGYSKAEVIGRSLDILIPERFRAIHQEHVARFATGQATARRVGGRQTPIIGLRKNGEEFPADATISKLDVGGKRMMTVALRDITELKRVENEQRFLADVGEVLTSTLDYEETLRNIAQLAVRDLADFCIVDIVEEMVGTRRLKVLSRDPSKAWICDLFMQVPLEAGHTPLVRSVLANRQTVLYRSLSSETFTSAS